MKHSVVNFRLSNTDKAHILAIGEATGKSQSDILREALDAYLATQRQYKPERQRDIRQRELQM